MTFEEFAKNTSELEQRLINDPIVSDDIKQLAASVRFLADWAKDSDDTMEKMADIICSTQDAVITLQKRPARNITVNYGK